MILTSEELLKTSSALNISFDKSSTRYERPIAGYKRKLQSHVKTFAIHQHLPKAAQSAILYYDKLLEWIEANPSIRGLAATMKTFYIFPAEEKNESIEVINIRSNYQRFKDFIMDFSQDRLKSEGYITGRKGIGKTFFINYFLNTVTPSLTRRNIMWYRVNASMIYQENISFQDYFFAQVVYVSLKYPKSCRYLNDVIANCDEFTEYLGKVPNSGNVQNLSTLMNRYKNEITLTPEAKPTVSMERGKQKTDTVIKAMLAGALKDSRKVIEIEVLAKGILNYLSSKGVKLLFIVDSIDNIDYHKDSNKYTVLLDDIIKCFSLGFSKPAWFNAKVLIVLRDETMAHVHARVRTVSRPEQFRIKAPTVEEMTVTKIEGTLKEVSNYFKKYRKEAAEGFIKDEDNWCNQNGIVQEKFDSAFKEFAKSFAPNLCKLFEEMKLLFLKEPRDIFLNIYNENIRAFIKNLLNCYRYKILFESKKYLIDREYAFMEGLVLDGSLYLDSSEDKKDWREAFVNIFYYEKSFISHIWHGLCGIRILDLLLMRGPHQKEDIKNTLSKIFDYDQSIIEEIIQRFVQHGLIQIEEDGNDEIICYSITKRGEFIKEVSLSDLNILYFLALDTPLKYQITTDSKCVEVHPVYWKQYPDCAIKTTITMIRHIKAQIHDENKLLGQKMIKKDVSTSLCKSFRDQSTKVSFDRVIKQMISMLRILEKNDKVRYENVIWDLEGLTGEEG